MYGVLPSTKIAMSISSTIKDKSIKKILDNSGPRTDPCGTQILFHDNYFGMNLFWSAVSYLTNNPE